MCYLADNLAVFRACHRQIKVIYSLEVHKFLIFIEGADLYVVKKKVRYRSLDVVYSSLCIDVRVYSINF